MQNVQFEEQIANTHMYPSSTIRNRIANDLKAPMYPSLSTFTQNYGFEIYSC